MIYDVRFRSDDDKRLVLQVCERNEHTSGVYGVYGRNFDVSESWRDAKVEDMLEIVPLLRKVKS